MCEPVSRAVLALALWLAAMAAVADEPVADPMRPPAVQGRAPAEDQARTLVLHSTLVSGPQRSAVINGRVVTVGERIGGARVLEILPGEVRLRGAQGQFRLRLNNQHVKKQVRP